ncbi:hypothetical protein SAMN04487906_0102 [Zhouia amylolytica]|uniref:DUF1761 domain-containing protein n=2 Tax=Zhouia amylolytica TaxID=376730 RepID=W2UK50_9FLAO|nr:hypothetical protein [Zhouia amylolytica]ETN93816.1 hypothetical protein P278_32260 [Zhouia amylolytica AD3]MCQ0111738.1 hypothetical protein [Zhouia amylolytica]SFS34784.1 hypothetical protein SAMN04487906_0102 [Zhouia amylolytica]
MFSKSNLLATIIATIVFFFLGYAVWGIALSSYFEAHATNNVMKAMPNMGTLVFSNLIMSFAMSTIYGKWATGKYSAASGFSFGAWIGIFVGFGLGFLWYSTSDLMDLTGTIVEAILDIFFYGIIGLVIGIVYQKTS